LIITNTTEINQDIDFEAGQVLLINKELNWTSFDVANKIRFMLGKKLGLKKIKVGHGGTLDPLATGLMLVCIGKETKNQVNYQCEQKAYCAEITLGATTPSFDKETGVNQTFEYCNITREQVEAVLEQKFTGTIQQRPPLYSAKFVNGVRAYEMAREGQDVKLDHQDVTIHSIRITDWQPPLVSVEVACSKGTYIRSLANDIGAELGCGAYLSGLVRSESGKFHLRDAMTVSEFENKLLYLIQGK